MMHEYYELSLEEMYILSTKTFLEYCEEYLRASLVQAQSMEDDRKAAEYARYYLDLDSDTEFRWLLGLE